MVGFGFELWVCRLWLMCVYVVLLRVVGFSLLAGWCDVLGFTS